MLDILARIQPQPLQVALRLAVAADGQLLVLQGDHKASSGLASWRQPAQQDDAIVTERRSQEGHGVEGSGCIVKPTCFLLSAEPVAKSATRSGARPYAASKYLFSSSSIDTASDALQAFTRSADTVDAAALLFSCEAAAPPAARLLAAAAPVSPAFAATTAAAPGAAVCCRATLKALSTASPRLAMMLFMCTIVASGSSAFRKGSAAITWAQVRSSLQKCKARTQWDTA